MDADKIIYLDYSATTPVNEEVLDSFVKATRTYVGNPNSLHKLGVSANKLINDATKQISDILNVKPNEIIYTSGASEANNLAIKGICLRNNKRKHIITTELEHSSVIGPCSYLQRLGYEVDFVKLDENGIVDLNDLKKLIKEDTILVSIASVNSEVGVLQPINEIGKLIKEVNKNTYFHSDITQSVGKVKINLDYVDLASFSAQKFYGLKGVGCLIKKENIVLEPLIHGGKSTTVYRSGTPALGLIVSTAKALRLAYLDFDKKYDYVCFLNKYLKEELSKINKVHINSNSYCVPHIVNISIENIKPETMQHALEQEEIYVSTQTACSSNNPVSKAVLAVTKNKNYASSSIRISLSYLTTKEEIDMFVKVLNNKIKELS